MVALIEGVAAGPGGFDPGDLLALEFGGAPQDLDSSRMAEPDIGQHPVRPARQGPGPTARDAEQNGQEEQADQRGVEQHRDAQDDPHLLR
jgi:hypothetical protein